MNAKHRITTRFLSVVLALAMLMGAAVSGHAQTEDGPNIPGDKDGYNQLNDYDPEKDGYFGYLPVRYYTSPLDVADSEVEEKDLPVIVWNKKIYAAAEDLGKITGLKVTEQADKIKFDWKERHLVVTRDSTDASFTLGTYQKGQYPYLEERIALSAAPFRGTGQRIYVPMTDICAVMDIDLIAQTASDGEHICYAINPPQEDVYDVLASFRDDALRESCMFMYEVDKDLLEYAEISSRAVITLDGMINGKVDKYLYSLLNVLCTWDYLEQYKPEQYIWNKVVLGKDPERKDIDKEYWNVILAKSLIKDLWFASENETVSAAEKALDAMSSEIQILFYEGILNELSYDQVDYFEMMIQQLESANANQQYMMSARTYVKYFDMLERYNSQIKTIKTTLDKLGKVAEGVSTALTVLKTGLAAVNDLAAYYGRDKVMDDALDLFLNYKGFDYLTAGAVGKMREVYRLYSVAPAGYALARAIWDSVTEEVIGKGMGVVSLAAAGYKIATAAIPEYQETLDSMVAYQTSLLSIAMQHEAHDDAYRGILINDRDIHALLRGDFLDKEILQAYLYFKSCATTRELVQKAFEYEDPLLDELYRKLTLLELTYGFTENGRPISYAERFAEVFSGLDEIMIGEAVIALYMTVSGKVLTFGDEKPVPDAVSLVTEHGWQRVWFEADGAGAYRDISIPVFWPDYGITEFDREFDIELYFYSKDKDIEGDDTKYVAFQSTETVDVDDAHLLWKGSMETVVVDKDDGERIEDPEYYLEHLDPEIYEKYGIRTVFSGKGGDFGYVLQEELPPGKYRAVFSKEGYESEELEIEIESGEVTTVPDVELKKKSMWLLVTEDYQDIANRGLWSKRMDYTYDKNGRLIERGGLSAASDYRYYEYDSDSRPTLQIMGSSGSTWMAERYTYDPEGRVTRVDLYTLDYEGVSSWEDWKTKALTKNGWNIYYYNGELLVKIDHYSKDGSFSYGQYYEYDEDGKLIYDIEVDIEGNQLVSDLGKRYMTTYEYDEKGRLAKDTYVGSRVITTTYGYDEEDRLVREENLYTGYVTVYRYDENGNLAEKDVYNGTKLSSKTLYYYKLFPFDEE